MILNKIKNARIPFIMVMFICILSSCGSATKVVYLQDIQPNITVALQEAQDIKLRSGDKLNIIVHSRDQELVQMFNLVNNTNGGSGANGNYSLYTIDNTGKIDMPILGLMTVEGLTRIELANMIKYKLLAGNLVRDPIVTVEYANLGYSVLGEVNNPGRKEIERDRVTLLEALAEAGDLTIQGRRDNILVLRTEEGKQTPYRIDLTQTNSVYSSPVYYLQQNDMIYVEPNDVRANQSTLNANTTRTPSFWISSASFIMTLILFLTN